MKIPWTKCSERMPPDDVEKIILKDGYGINKTEGSTVHWDYGVCIDLDAEWTPLTEETWRKLNERP